jgi:hypothetical protein
MATTVDDKLAMSLDDLIAEKKEAGRGASPARAAATRGAGGGASCFRCVCVWGGAWCLCEPVARAWRTHQTSLPLADRKKGVRPG